MGLRALNNPNSSFEDVFSNTGTMAGATSPSPEVEATGGTATTPGDGYKYHFFTSTGSNPFNVTVGGSIEYVLIAGGGSGADRGNGAGGGGAGGVLGNGMDFQHQHIKVVVLQQLFKIIVFQ